MTAVLVDSTAIRHCEAITRREARNFWYGIRLLPPTKRRMLAAVYAMSRRIDDIGDGDLPVDQKLAALAEVDSSLESVHRGSQDPVLAALGEALTVCPLPLHAFHDLVEGVRMDVQGFSYESIDDLVPYCRRVAGSVGRLSLAVFRAGEGPANEALDSLADDLGVALQLTNIIRDIREDYGNRRVYLPADDLTRFGVETRELGGPSSSRAIALVRFEAARAHQWFDRGLRLMSHLDRRSAACAGAMAGIYARLLVHIERDPDQVFRRRVSLPAWEKAWVALRALSGVTP